MIRSTNEIKTVFFNCLNSMAENPWVYTTSPNAFVRHRKISFSDTILSTICMQKSSLSSEILKFFDFRPDSPTHSALIQQRSKVSVKAFEDLFSSFTSALSPDRTLKGYRLFAVDGSDICLPRNPEDPDTYRISDIYGKGFNMLHLNASYDLLSRLYTDIIIQPCNRANEYRALCDMIDHFASVHPDEKALFIGDRGFVSFNIMAHAIENNAFFLIRARDPSSRTLLSSVDLPDSPEFEITFERWLTRRNTKTIMAQPQIYKSIGPRVFDYLEPKSRKLYYICFRIIKIQLSNGSAEYLYTNLPPEDFTTSEIRELYHMRWDIETSFRDIKYAAGMVFFHSRKKQLILQEIYAKLILYNFSEAIIGGVVCGKKDRKYAYQINVPLALAVCVEFIRRQRNGAPIERLEELLMKKLIPVRPGRSSPRYIKARTATSFQYR